MRLPQVRGFTLVEVLVALVVVALGLTALMVAVNGTARTSGLLRDKTLAQWIALNRLSEVRLNVVKFGQNTDTGELNFASRKWHYDTRYFDTSIASMKRVVVRVYLGDAKTKGNPIAQAVGFLGGSLSPAGSTIADWTQGVLAAPAGGTPNTGTPNPGAPNPGTPPPGTPIKPVPTPAHSAVQHAAQPMSARPKKLRHGAAGFTLVEILVALLILAIMAALGYSTYRAARISAERTEVSLKRSREIEFGMRIMVADFAQMVPRPVRDILGQGRLPALRGTPGAGSVTATSASLGANSSAGAGSNSGMSFNSGTNSGSTPSPGMSFNSSSNFGATTDPSAASMVDLTRAGWSNTAGQQRSTLQRVSYALVGDVLKRSYQINLDTVQGNKPVVQDLLTGVVGVQLRYLDANQAWQNQWPEGAAIQNGSTADLQSRPVAVEIIVQFKDWGAIRRLIEVSG